MISKIKPVFFIVLAGFLTIANYALARGGGGGSGGGGGGGGFSGSYSGGSSGSASGNPWGLLIGLIVFAVIIAFSYFANKKKKQQMLEKQTAIIAGNSLNWPQLRIQIEDLFKKFQKAWGEFDLRAMEQLLTSEYYKRMVLELSVLQNEQRANPMDNVTVNDIYIVGEEQPGEAAQELTLQISASAHDVLMDTKNNKTLFVDDSGFTEYWHLVQDETKKWKLDFITQETENRALVENAIASFAETNHFYYDADFGWLMMPNKGVLFNKTNFGNSDINNHVIGYFRNKIVEFYTYIPNTRSKTPDNYLVAQAILPKSYNDILIKKKGFLNFAPWGLNKMQTESADFNNRFALYATPEDQINSLELLAPNFMEKIYNLPFELNIELVGNTLYFYTKDRGSENYPQMLEIISWAFDEMKM